MAAPARADDTGETLHDFLDVVLVRCPRCGGCARADRRRALCAACGFVRDAPEGAPLRIDPDADPVRDPFHGLPLWLQTPCRGHVLWACDAAHLDRIDAWVGASLRTRRRDPRTGWSNRSLVTRLPDWLCAASARDDARRAVARLRALLPEAPR